MLTVFFTLLQNLPHALGSVLLVVAFNITSGSSHNIDMKNYLKGSFDDTIIFILIMWPNPVRNEAGEERTPNYIYFLKQSISAIRLISWNQTPDPHYLFCQMWCNFLFSVGTKTKFLIFVGVSYWLLCDRCILDFFFSFFYTGPVLQVTSEVLIYCQFSSWIREDSFNLNIETDSQRTDNRLYLKNCQLFVNMRESVTKCFTMVLPEKYKQHSKVYKLSRIIEQWLARSSIQYRKLQNIWQELKEYLMVDTLRVCKLIVSG